MSGCVPAAMRICAVVGAAACLAMLAAACGGSPGAQVAQLGATTTTRATDSAAQVNGAVAYSRCMRSHRVPAYPDPGSGGRIPKEAPQQLGVSPSELQAAQAACIHLVPNGGQPTAAQVQKYRSDMLIYARCIRAHGVPNMPDPDSRGHLDIGPGTGVDVDSPRFEAAYQDCKSKLSP